MSRKVEGVDCSNFPEFALVRSEGEWVRMVLGRLRLVRLGWVEEPAAICCGNHGDVIAEVVYW